MSASTSPSLGAPDALKRGPSLSSLQPNERASTPPAYASDPKYKKYTQQVEKCLNSFDSVHEWADFIAFLKQLLKTFQSYMQFKEIPRKLVVSKRLSQCLNPALPTGVHQRALDVYSHILAVLGSEGLQRDLALWSSGLFPFFAYAATSVKPTLLSLFDTHYIPLQHGLRPIMKSFVLALLPGLEEETGEYFDKVVGLLDRLSGTVSQSFFFQTIWLIMLTTPSARGTSLNFLARRLPVLKADEDITHIVGRDVGLMIRAFSSALEDDDLLVRRGALDLLLQALRINSIAVARAQPEDRVILMRAASSVVLRRDLSLNRRLYSWLLGPDDHSQQQVDYFKANALELLRSTLRDEMFNPSAEYAQSRPFKIFISLLDKWEIGSPLTEVLVFDAFKAIKKAIETGCDPSDDLTMTANTLYEAVEPQLLWKEFFSIVFVDLISDGSHFEGFNMVKYLLATLHTRDEEIEHVHLPVGLCAILELLTVRMKDERSRIPYASMHEVLSLLAEIFRHIPPAATLMSRPQVNGQPEATTGSDGSYQFACAFYGIENRAPRLANRRQVVPFITAFEDLVEMNTLIGNALMISTTDTNIIREVFVQSLMLFGSLVGRLERVQDPPLAIDWDHTEWLSVMMRCLNHKTAAFSIVDNVVTISTRLQQVSQVEPKFSIDNRLTISAMINILLKYLRQPWVAYHMRAVTLLWSLEGTCRSAHVESVIAQNMASSQQAQVQEACEAFGVLWRLTDDNLVPGFRLKVPMMIVLDTLKSEDTNLRRIGETWMRCSLKSYLRVLDPILFDLFDPSIQRLPSTVELNGKQLDGFSYDRPFDQHYVNHVLELLLSVVKFGGQGFSKVARTTQMTRSPYAPLLQRLQLRNTTFPDATYMDVVLHMLLGFLQSEPRSALKPAMHSFNMSSQSVSVDLLQAIVARGELDFPALQPIEAAVVKKLYFCIHMGRLDLQNKLLHLLHSVISASHGAAEGYKGSKAAHTIRGTDGSISPDLPQSPETVSYTIDPLLIQTLVDGISTSNNRPVFQHWLDFILMTVPQFHYTMQTAVGPLNETVCRQLRLALTDVRRASADGPSHGDVVSYSTDSDFMMLLTAVERLALLSLSNLADATQIEEESTVEKPAQESGGLLGYVSNVFSSDSAAGTTEGQNTKSSDYVCLHEAVRVLYSIWEGLSGPGQHTWTSREESLSLIFTRTRTRCRRVLEHLFRAHSTEVLESIVDCWHRESTNESAVFEIVDILTSSAQNVVHMVCECILSRMPGLSERTKKQIAIPSLTDMILFDFLEQYMRRLEGPLAMQVWGQFLHLAKDLVASLREFKVQAFATLRCFTVLAEKVCQTTATEDRRLRKELQETYGKLLDICVIASRSFDQGSWIRRSHKDTLLPNGRDSPRPRVPSDTKYEERKNISVTSLQDTVKPNYSADVVEQINIYIATDVLPNLRRFLMEGDKILSACNNIIYSVVSPSLKGKARPLDVEDNVLLLIQEMSKIGAAQKAWRGPIGDALNDNRCFNSSPESGGKWRPMMKALFDSDKTSLAELLNRITTTASSNIFTNREYEMLLRSLNLRRLSYVLLSGEKNHFLTQLPTIQEKLVDTLRNVSAPVVQSEVYLCIRVLLCRLSPHNLSSFWPVILTELYRLFDQALASLPSDGSEELGLILAACKLLDLLLVLQTEEFQIHQWIFITDTVDAVYRPDNWFPEAILDRLAEATNDLPIAEQNGTHPFPTSAMSLTESRPMRRPMLRSLRQIDSIRDLVPFFSSASIVSYESVYSSGGNIDWEAIEQGLLEDMFEGR
ncbi:hypothetical protein SCP_0103960 [Sparassis crispa]|uniref:Uncharacterized protein n=1 Tax=Sparassis crispa TaxID=139825 RepID=A0A401G5T0_9APHY|nr:hypothetical protein SCP_0103960 [Sparassis crispa]GBE77521.1 hypothetical protein SCP_0103960 [Sparassis crispa]